MRCLAATVAILGALAAGACGESDRPERAGGEGTPADVARLSGDVVVAVPALLAPLLGAAQGNFEAETQATVEVDRADGPEALEMLCRGEVAIAGYVGAGAPAAGSACPDAQVRRITIAHQAVAVAANEALGIECLSLIDLRRLWNAGSEVESYRQLSPGLPKARVRLFGATADRAPELFTAIVNGREGRIRDLWTPVANAGAFTASLRRSDRALGFVNLPELVPARPGPVERVAVDAGTGCVEPTEENVQSGAYPLARDLHLYLGERAQEDPTTGSFARYLVEDYQQLSGSNTGAVDLGPDELERAREQVPDAPTPRG